MDPFQVMLRVAEAMFWVAAAIVGVIYRLCRMLFFFWRKHHRCRRGCGGNFEGWRNLRLVQSARTGVGAPAEITP
jgi:hypothetical protein